MRFLAWHVERVKADPTERGRSPIAEEPRPVSAENALFVFAQFEKSDESLPIDIVRKATDEIACLATQLMGAAIVLNPFAHLFAEPCRPEVAVEMLREVDQGLGARGLSVQRLSFGVFYELEMKAKGHRMSRIARTIG